MRRRVLVQKFRLSVEDVPVDLEGWNGEIHIFTGKPRMDQGLVYVLWAQSGEHRFSEIFTSPEKVEEYLKNHPDVVKKEVTMHELNPQ